MRHLSLSGLVLICLALMASAFPSSADAAAERLVADRFTFDVQFIYEPAIQGDTNGLQIRILDGENPVEGIAGDFTNEVEFVGAKRALPMTEVPNAAGTYRSTFIPMQAGEYMFHINVTIDGVEIHETFTVSDGIANVVPRTDYEFPNAANGMRGEVVWPIAATAITGIIVFGWRKRDAGA